MKHQRPALLIGPRFVVQCPSCHEYFLGFNKKLAFKSYHAHTCTPKN